MFEEAKNIIEYIARGVEFAAAPISGIAAVEPRSRHFDYSSLPAFRLRRKMKFGSRSTAGWQSAWS